MRHFITFFIIVLAAFLVNAAPTPATTALRNLEDRGLPTTPPSLPDPNSWIFDRALLGSIQGQAKTTNKEFFSRLHRELMNAWKAQVEVKRYWEVVAEIRASDVAQAVDLGSGSDLGVRESEEWAREDKFQWRTNCEWLIGVSRRLTSVYKLPVPALSIFPDATPRYCMLKL